MAGVYLLELRLPGDAVVALVQRDGRIFVPDHVTVLRPGDHLPLATSEKYRDLAERRLRAVSRAGRLAGWFGEQGSTEQAEPAGDPSSARPSPVRLVAPSLIPRLAPRSSRTARTALGAHRSRADRAGTLPG